MTVINTNVAALTARTYAVQANEKMQQSMERLSSGLRINSAADDAAGMAVSNKMESQLRGMNVAIRNSQDGISLVQTAEAGMSEITNMIIRMRELSVQMNNGVYTNSDRANAQLEIDALLLEIDKIATNTAFNDVKVLDGSYDTDIRAGNTNPENIQVAVTAQTTSALGGVAMSSTPATAKATGTRTDNGDGTSTSTLKVKAATEAQIDLATANAAVTASSGETLTHILTAPAGWDIRSSGDNIGQVYSTSAPTASSTAVSLTVKSAAIKDSTAIVAGGYTSGTKTDNSGTDEWTSTVSVVEAGDGTADAVTLAVSTAMAADNDATYFKLASGDDSGSFSVNNGTGSLSYTGNSNKLRFDYSSSPDNSLTVKLQGYNFDSAGTLAITDVDNGTTNGSTRGAIGGTGAARTKAYTVKGSDDKITIALATDVDAANKLKIDGTTAQDVTGHSVTSALTGISGATAAVDTTSGVITIDNVGFLAADTDVTFAVKATTGTGDHDVVTTYTVTIQASEKVAEETVNMTVTDSVGAEYDKIALTVTGNDYLANVDVSTSAGAARAVTILDKALDEISSSQAKLGAIQNRLQHNIDNLSNGSRLTETARGRIVDADFARETSELSKQQILGQAATSMLAQANQSKQSVLALLQ